MSSILRTVPFAALQKNTEMRLGERFPEQFFLVCFAIDLLLSWNLNIPYSEMLHFAVSLLRIVLAGCFLLKAVFLSGYNWGEELGLCLSVIIFGVASVLTRQIILFCTVTILFAAKNVHFRRLTRLAFWELLAIFVVTLILTAAGAVSDFIMTRGEAAGALIRHSLGFNHPNLTGLWCMMMVFSGIFTFYEKMKTRHFLYFLLAAVVCYFVTFSRTSVLISVLGILLFYILRQTDLFRSESKLNRIIALSIVPLVILLFWILTLVFSPGSVLMTKLDVLFSGRLSLSREGLALWGISAIGQAYTPLLTIDSLYVLLPIRYGIIPSLLLLILTEYGIFRAAKARCPQLIGLYLLIALYSTMEQAMINPYNLPLFAVFAALPADNARGLEQSI